MLRKPSIDTLKAVMHRKKHKLFDGAKPFDLNIIGIRADTQINNQFNDLICVLYRDGQKRERIAYFNATTDPSNYYLKHPINVDGTACMVEGQYLKAYKVGTHKGNAALRQAKAIPFHRYDENAIAANKSTRAMIGANIHQASTRRATEKIGRWSAGCQVIAYNFDFFWFLISSGHKHWGPRFSYTLMNETDFLA